MLHIISKLTIITEWLQLVLQGLKDAWSATDYDQNLTQQMTHEALLELGVGLRAIDLETLSFLGVRHCEV